MRYKDRLPWQICCGGLFFVAVTPPCTTKGSGTKRVTTKGSDPLVDTLLRHEKRRC